jgi:HD superfamily phosphohydrolase
LRRAKNWSEEIGRAESHAPTIASVFEAITILLRGRQMPYLLQRKDEKGNVETLAHLETDWIKTYRLTDAYGNFLPPLENGLDYPIPILGSGGFGVVVRAMDQLALQRVVKVIDPSRMPQEVGATDLLKQEISLTTGHPLKHTVPILDFGFLTDAHGVEISFYVMPYISGTHFDIFFNQVIEANRELLRDRAQARNLLRDLFLSLTDQVLAALVELAEFRIVHMDISGSNVLVYVPDDTSIEDLAGLVRNARAFVIDLGAAKQMRPGHSGYTIFIRHKYYFPIEIEDDLGKSFVAGRVYQQIMYEKLDRFWPLIDSYCFARLLEAVTLDRAARHSRNFSGDPAAEFSKETTWRHVLANEFAFVRGVIDRLLQIRNPVYRHPGRVKELFATIRPAAAASAYDSETLTDRHVGSKIRAGQYLVKIAPPLNAIVDHPTFQRLRRYNQLAFINEIYPNATHNRFTHSLQTFELAKRYIFSVSRTPEFRFNVSRIDVEHILAAALLHDIGQYPLAHSIEDLRRLADDCGSRYKQEHARGEIADDVYAAKVKAIEPLRSIEYDQEAASVQMTRQDVLDRKGRTIADILTDASIDIGTVVYMFQKSPKDYSRPMAHSIGRDIIAGHLDADRVAYLTLDSEASGVPFGLAVDVGALVEALTVRADGVATTGLAIEESAVSAAEAVTAAVYWMYRNVYWHRTNRAFMAAVKFVVRRLMMEGGLLFKEYVARVDRSHDLDALKFLEETYGHHAFNPLSSLVACDRIGFRRVLSIGVELADTGVRLDEKQMRRNVLYQRLVKGIDIEREERILRALRENCGWATSPVDGEILLDVPLKPRLRWARGGGLTTAGTLTEVGERVSPLWVKSQSLSREGTRWQTFQQASMLARHLSYIEDVAGRKIRVFVARSVLCGVSDAFLDHLPDVVEEVLVGVTADWHDVTVIP